MLARRWDRHATFAVVGACHLLGALLTVRAWPRRRPGLAGAGFIMIAGAGLVVAGLAPENVNGGWHAAGALSGLVALNLGMIVLGVAMLAGRRGLARLTMATGIVGFVGLATFLIWPRGLAERLADYPGTAMIVVLGLVMLVAAARPLHVMSRGMVRGRLPDDPHSGEPAQCQRSIADARF